MYLLDFHKLEKDEEGHDHLFFALLRLEKGTEIGLGVCLQVGADIKGLGVDIDFFAFDPAEPASDRVAAALFSAKDFAEYFFQPLEVCAAQEILVVNGRLVAAHLPGEILRTKITHAGLLPADSEFLGHIFEHLVFQKAADQFFAGIRFFLAGLLVFFAGQEHTALDIQKRRRHDEKFAGDIHVLVVHLTDICQVLVGDLNDGNIVDVYFVFFNQVHEEIQRPLKDRKLYGNCHNRKKCLHIWADHNRFMGTGRCGCKR